MRPVQFFTDEYLEQCKAMRPLDIVKFLEEFRQLHGAPQTKKSKLISLKIQENLLETFKRNCTLHGVKYQTKIKELMQEWLRQRA